MLIPPSRGVTSPGAFGVGPAGRHRRRGDPGHHDRSAFDVLCSGLFRSGSLGHFVLPAIFGQTVPEDFPHRGINSARGSDQEVFDGRFMNLLPTKFGLSHTISYLHLY
jgi:hypothetical protein